MVGYKVIESPHNIPVLRSRKESSSNPFLRKAVGEAFTNLHVEIIKGTAKWHNEGPTLIDLEVLYTADTVLTNRIFPIGIQTARFGILPFGSSRGFSFFLREKAIS